MPIHADTMEPKPPSVVCTVHVADTLGQGLNQMLFARLNRLGPRAGLHLAGFTFDRVDHRYELDFISLGGEDAAPCFASVHHVMARALKTVNHSRHTPMRILRTVIEPLECHAAAAGL